MVKRETLAVDGFGLFHVALIRKSGERSCLRDGVDVERLSCFLQDVCEAFGSQAEADAQGGEAVDFRTGAQYAGIATFADVFQRVGGVVEKFVIRFIEYGDENSETVRAVIGDELDDMFGISESMSEYEAENEEDEDLTVWIKEGVKSNADA
jgi:hypothetical protein